MFAIVFKSEEGDQLLLKMPDGGAALYFEKEEAVSVLNKTLKEVNYELDGSPERYGNSWWGYRTVRYPISDDRKELLLRLKSTIEIKKPNTFRFEDGTKLKGSK